VSYSACVNPSPSTISFVRLEVPEPVSLTEEVLFTSERTHPTETNIIFGNCMAITQILNNFLIEKYKIDYRLFKPTENALSDEEFEYLKS
jgi:hypothetical protein